MSTRVGAVAIALALLAGACGDDDPLAAEPCVPSDPAPAEVVEWSTSDGCAMPIDVLHSHPGPAECGWELIDYLVTDNGTYHWDPVNFLSYVDGQPRNRTFKTADLPEGATDSGMRRGDEALWRDIADDEFVYVISGDFADRYLLDRDDAIICR